MPTCAAGFWSGTAGTSRVIRPGLIPRCAPVLSRPPFVYVQPTLIRDGSRPAAPTVAPSIEEAEKL